MDGRGRTSALGARRGRRLLRIAGVARGAGRRLSGRRPGRGARDSFRSAPAAVRRCRQPERRAVRRGLAARALPLVADGAVAARRQRAAGRGAGRGSAGERRGPVAGRRAAARGALGGDGGRGAARPGGRLCRRRQRRHRVPCVTAAGAPAHGDRAGRLGPARRFRGRRDRRLPVRQQHEPGTAAFVARRTAGRCALRRVPHGRGQRPGIPVRDRARAARRGGTLRGCLGPRGRRGCP